MCNAEFLENLFEKCLMHNYLRPQTLVLRPQSLDPQALDLIKSYDELSGKANKICVFPQFHLYLQQISARWKSRSSKSI